MTQHRKFRPQEYENWYMGPEEGWTVNDAFWLDEEVVVSGEASDLDCLKLAWEVFGIKKAFQVEKDWEIDWGMDIVEVWHRQDPMDIPEEGDGIPWGEEWELFGAFVPVGEWEWEDE